MGTDTKETKRDRKTGSSRTTYLSCEAFDTGSGSDYCDSKDKDCKKWCAGSSYLNLSGTSRNTCYEMEKDTVETLADWFKERGTIGRPDYDDLNELDSDDLELLCSAVRLDYKLLERYFKDYSKNHARIMLSWVAQNKEFLDVLDNAESRGNDKGVPLLRELLKSAGTNSGSDSDKIMSGLAEDLKQDKDTDSTDQQHVLSLAEDASNEDFINYVHNNVIADDDDGLCEENDRPNPDAGTSGQPYDTDASHGNEGEDAKGYDLEACILGVYCKIAEESLATNATEDNDFRESIAGIVSNGDDVSDWINTAKTSGGLDNQGGGAISGASPAASSLLQILI